MIVYLCKISYGMFWKYNVISHLCQWLETVSYMTPVVIMGWRTSVIAYLVMSISVKSGNYFP